MARPRKHTDARDIALARVAAGSVPKRVAEELGIPIETLRSWLRRGTDVRPEAAATGFTASRREQQEIPAVDLTDTVTTSVKSAVRHLRAVAKELKVLGSDPDSAIAVAGLRIRLAEAWGGLAKTAIASGLPKLVVTTQTGVSGVHADVELLRATIALIPGAKDGTDGTQSRSQHEADEGGQPAGAHLASLPLPPGDAPDAPTPDP